MLENFALSEKDWLIQTKNYKTFFYISLKNEEISFVLIGKLHTLCTASTKSIT